MSKIKILVISNDVDGVGYYRINSPYLYMNDHDIDIRFLSNNDFSFKFDENSLKDYNIIIYHKYIPFRIQENKTNFNEIVKKYDIKVIFDIDDYWDLEKTQINYKSWMKNNSPQIVKTQIKEADYVTTTTPILADFIKEINPNVIIFENAINHKESQWIPNKIESNKTRFIWGGGISHQEDLMLLNDTFKNLDKKTLNQMQMYLCGFDLRMRTKDGTYLTGNPSTSRWVQFESIFTNKLKNIKNGEYIYWLRKYTDIERNLYGYNNIFKDEFYQRRWSKPIFTYGKMYNEADVALAPLVDNAFNSAKSQLKVLEAGIHKLPIIASNVGPYKLDIIDGKNGFLIDNSNRMEWRNKIKYFIDNPNAVEDMGMALNELILSKYTLERINLKRIEFLKNI